LSLEWLGVGFVIGLLSVIVLFQFFRIRRLNEENDSEYFSDDWCEHNCKECDDRYICIGYTPRSYVEVVGKDPEDCK